MLPRAPIMLHDFWQNCCASNSGQVAPPIPCRITGESRGWNISGEICSGTAVDDTPFNANSNPGIRCDCSCINRTTCHISTLQVTSMSDWNSSSNVVGPLPDELWTLTYLTSLNLGYNYLTGPIPPAVSNLAQMQYLALGGNAFSGQLLRELGQLSDLRQLAVVTNNLTGSLPDEIGNCTRLASIFIDSSGLSGPIPSTFSNLRSLQIMFAMDTELTGPIPDFIGSWILSDICDSSFQLDFLANMTSLVTLVLRNNSISGSIPSSIYENRNLSLLNLSFNNLTGQIPSSLFTQNSLIHLFLGNNRLAGFLPEQKASELLYIDLSYNELSGNFPSWVSQQALQLNLVATNYTLLSTNNSGLPTGLNCLQQGFPCYRGDPQYFSIAIKCGGSQRRSANGIVFEADNATLGPSTYYVTRDNRWAVSNAGLTMNSDNPRYQRTDVTVIPNTRDPELFLDARLSARSLRYYGFGLQNGNYTVILQFTEIAFPDDTVWQSGGRRMFDIYIQGNLRLRDFGI